MSTSTTANIGATLQVAAEGQTFQIGTGIAMYDFAGYEKSGYLLLNGVLSPADLAELKSWVETAASFRGPEAGVTDAGELQAIYGVHLLKPAPLLPIRSAPLHALLKSLLNEDFYLYQSQLHLKPGSSRSLDWHQDFRAFHEYDGLPSPDGAIVGTFVDGIDADMAPVHVIPGSHRHGLLEAELGTLVPSRGPTGQSGTDNGPKFAYRITESVLEQSLGSYKVVDLVGSAGTVFVCHPNLVHGSGINMTGRRRAILYTNVFRQDVTPALLRRPAFVVSRDHRPIASQ